MLFRPEKGTFKTDQKIEILEKGVHGFCQKSNFLSPLFFGQIKPKKNRFRKFWIKKECFLDHKTEVFKISNPWKCFKEVSPWLWSKNRSFYPVCFLGRLRKKTSFFDILNKKECFLDQKNRLSEKFKKSRFCKGVSLFFVKKWNLFMMWVFFSKSSPKRSGFFYIPDKKERFLDQKK